MEKMKVLVKSVGGKMGRREKVFFLFLPLATKQWNLPKATKHGTFQGPPNMEPFKGHQALEPSIGHQVEILFSFFPFPFL